MHFVWVALDEQHLELDLLDFGNGGFTGGKWR